MIQILVPTDFSKNAWHALNYAVYLFEREACTFYILHAHQVSPSGLISTMSRERDTRLHEITTEESARDLDKIITHFKKINKVANHFFEPLLVSDSLLNAVGGMVVAKQIDYIFMGTQGASGLKEIFMGSNTVSVIKHIDFCPVVAVPEGYDYDLPDEIVFATNYKHLYQQAELRPLLSLSGLWDTPIRVVHISTEKVLSRDQNQLKKLLGQMLKGVAHSFEERPFYPTVSVPIKKLAREHSVGMIAMINSRHSYIRRLMREAVIKKVAFKVEVPFLVLPEAE